MKQFSLFLLCLGVFGAAADLTYEEATEVIKDHVSSFKAGRGLCDTHTCCNITSTETCPLSSMPKDQTTMVLPGGETRCIFSTSTPFAFQVIPGDSDKLIFYLQGGGACWSKYTTTPIPFCTTDSSPQSLVGIFDRNNEKNVFKSHTIVHVSYCSGDVHGGNVVQPYNDPSGQPVVQKGLANAQSALDWAVAQQASGALSSTLSQLVVMGCSAGSIGAQLWGKQVVGNLKWSQAAVIPDSYAGVFPEGSMGPLIYSYGFCTSGFLSDALQKKCDEQTLTLQEMDAEFMQATPTVPWAFIQSKTDIVQQSFYIAIGISQNSSDKLITPTKFYSDVNDIFGGYNAQKNFVSYLVDGYHHCFTNQDLYYEADGEGPNDNGKSNTKEMLYSWTNHFPLANGESVSTVCEGDVQSVRGRPDNSYCSSTVEPKTFTEQY